VKYRISKILVIFLLISPRFVLGGSLPWKQEGKDFLSGTTLDVVFNSEGNITLPPPARPNLIPNGSFENGSGVDAENWTEGTGYTRDSTYAHSGGWAFFSALHCGHIFIPSFIEIYITLVYDKVF